MKILYAIQGTGNGHISRARDIIPALQKKGSVDILVSGCQADVDLPYPIRYRLNGLSFVFGKKGGIDYVETYKRSRIKKLYREILDLPVGDYDLVVSDFEPVSAWACRLRRQYCIGLSHQAAVADKHTPRPRKIDVVGSAVLKHYAPVDRAYGFHFLPYGRRMFTPVVRNEIRALQPVNEGHYTVYLPSYDNHRLRRFLAGFPDTRWEVFSRHCTEAVTYDHISFFPVSNEAFIHSISRAAGVLCGAGFETPAEVIFLQKKLMVVPMKGQYEQQCNAAALHMMGVPVIRSLKPKHAAAVRGWIDSGTVVSVDYPDETEEIVSLVVEEGLKKKAAAASALPVGKKASAFRDLLIRKIFYRTTK